MSSSGQSVTDRLNAAKHSLTGQGLAKAVCKSTTEEVSGPKRKHLDYLLQCTHETNVSVPQMADLLIQRTQTANWVVVFKSLVTVHNVMNYGSERYMQYMASNTVFSNLDSFNDRSTPQGYDMSTYIRKYAKYINEKAVAYRLMAFDFCKVKRGKEDGLLRTMAPEKLLKALPVLQAQIDALLEFDPSLNELNNGVINAAFLLLFKDLIRLFACYNDGIINLLEKFFEMNRKQCKEALDIYKKFLVRMDQTGEFLKVAENVGIDKGDIPDLTKAPASLLEALEAHLKSLEGKKASKLHASAQKAGGTGLSDEEKKKILAEEEKELQRMKERKEKAQSHSAQMESASQVPAQQTTQVIAPQPAAAAPAPSASDDLLALDASPFQAKANNVMSVANSSNQQWTQSPLDPMSLSPAPAQPTPGAFTSETGFASAFGTTQQSPMPGMFLQPSTAPLAPMVTNQQESKGQLLMPQKKEDQTPVDSKLVKKDLESSLASLTESKLVMTPGSMNKGNHQWGPEQPKKMTGGQNFQQVGQPAAVGAATTWMTPQQPVNQLMGQPPAGFNMQPSQQFFVNPAAPQLYPANYAANPYATNMAPPTYQPRPQQPMMPQQQQMMQPMQPQSTNNPDLFGL